jgi:hypothetical protein
MINKERSPNIKGNALHEKNTSYNFVQDQGSSRFPFLILLRAEFIVYSAHLLCGILEENPLFGFDLWLSIDIYKRRWIGSNLFYME